MLKEMAGTCEILRSRSDVTGSEGNIACKRSWGGIEWKPVVDTEHDVISSPSYVGFESGVFDSVCL